MSAFRQALQAGRTLLMDGAMGTELQRAGLAAGECGELWNLTHPERVEAIQRAYVASGADCLLTNTFQANPAALARHGRERDLERIVAAAVALARSAGGPGRFVLGDIGPVGAGEESLERVVHALQDVDAFLLETWPGLDAAGCAERVRRADVNPRGLPVLLSFTYRAGTPPCLHEGGHPPERAAEAAQAAGVAALGVNCGLDLGMDEVLDVVRRYRRVTELPLFVRPNAGTPCEVEGRWIYPRSPEELAARVAELRDAGVSLIGGCCGTTPEHIAAFQRALGGGH